MSDFRVWDRVRLPGGKPGRIVRLKRDYNQDGALVWSEQLQFGDGYLPHWVALRSLRHWEANRGS